MKAKHLVIGSRATGFWLEAHKEDVSYGPVEKGYDIYWVCTPDLRCLRKIKDGLIVIRTATPPGTIKRIKHKLPLYHCPEFGDLFYPSMVVLGRSGISSSFLKKLLLRLHPGIPLITTDSTTSEFIKLSFDCCMTAQNVFWNEIKRLGEIVGVNPQEVVNACLLDKRTSRPTHSDLPDEEFFTRRKSSSPLFRMIIREAKK